MKDVLSWECRDKLTNGGSKARPISPKKSAAGGLRKMDLASLSSALIGLIQVHGPWIISVVVALESAGVPLPGETILVAAALLAATTNQIDIAVVVAAAAAGAIIGDGIGYTVGRRFGMPFLRKYGRFIRLDENRLLIGRYLFFSVWERCRVFGSFCRGAPNVCGFACWRK
jgi:membrane protein YqaA with SNARE-associated domain